MRKRNRTERRQTARIMNNITQEEPKRMFSDEEIEDIFNTQQVIKNRYGSTDLKDVATLGIGKLRAGRNSVGVTLYITSANRDIFTKLIGCKKYDVRYKKLDSGDGYAALVQADTPSSSISNIEDIYPKDRIQLFTVRGFFTSLFEGDYNKRLVASAKESYIADNGTVVFVFRE